MMACNQEMIRTALAFLADEPPVLVDWMPWNHVAGGSHNTGIALYNGGSFYIDDGAADARGHRQRRCATSTMSRRRSISTCPRATRLLVAAFETTTELRGSILSRGSSCCNMPAPASPSMSGTGSTAPRAPRPASAS